MVIWMTGMSGAGKTTIANLLKNILYRWTVSTVILDGDNVRKGLNSDLSFGRGDRGENIRRIAEVAALLDDQGFSVIVSVICPFKRDRDLARDILGRDRVILLYVKCPLAVCEKRDVKGLYARARRGEISDFTGITAPYEEPELPDLTIDTSVLNLIETSSVLEKKLSGHFIK